MFARFSVFTGKKLSYLWGIKEEFKLKILLLSSTFLFMMACLVIWKPLKNALFAKMVGATFVPQAKLYSLFVVIPLILLYSKLVDWLRRHQLLYCFTLFHGLGGIIFYFFLAHPIYGIANTMTSPSRYLGWAFYFFMESFDAFFSTTFWSFADSISNPKDAKNYFGFLVSGSKFGGMVTAGSLYLLLTMTNIPESVLLPHSLLFGSCMLFIAAFFIYLLVKKVPESKMHGYEKVYRLEHEKSDEQKDQNGILAFLRESFAGLIVVVKNAYVMGLFALVIFYEVMTAIFDYLVMLKADTAYQSAGDLTSFYALYYFIFNAIGLVISIFGTTPLLRLLGIRTSLFVFPVMCFIMLVIAMIFPYGWMLVATLIGLRAFNYALNHPTKEVLYIPTTKEIKFKAKSWIDAFGSRIAKSFGSLFNIFMHRLSGSLAVFFSISLSLFLTTIWLVVVYFLGKTLQNAIDHNRAIGETKK